MLRAAFPFWFALLPKRHLIPAPRKEHCHLNPQVWPRAAGEQPRGIRTSRSVPCGGTTTRSPCRHRARHLPLPRTNMAAPAPPRHLPGPKMAPAAAAVSEAAPRWRPPAPAPRCQDPRWLPPLPRRGPRPARPRRRPQAVSALIKDGGGSRRWSVGSRRSLLEGFRGRHGGGRAGVRVRSLRQARCQRLPHPAAHLQPRVQVRERAAPAIVPARPGLAWSSPCPRGWQGGQGSRGLGCAVPCPGLPQGKAVPCGREQVWPSPEGPPAELWGSRRLELPLVGMWSAPESRGASAPCCGGAGAALLIRGRR